MCLIEGTNISEGRGTTQDRFTSLVLLGLISTVYYRSSELLLMKTVWLDVFSERRLLNHGFKSMMAMFVTALKSSSLTVVSWIHFFLGLFVWRLSSKRIQRSLNGERRLMNMWMTLSLSIYYLVVLEIREGLEEGVSKREY